MQTYIEILEDLTYSKDDKETLLHINATIRLSDIETLYKLLQILCKKQGEDYERIRDITNCDIGNIELYNANEENVQLLFKKNGQGDND